MASILKYCREIPTVDVDPSNRKITASIIKGYYSTEKDIVDEIISSVSQSEISDPRDFKTIEADIMDFADDVAYSIYDLEDSFKADVLRPEDIMGISPELMHMVAKDVRMKVAKRMYPRDEKQALQEKADSYQDSINADQIAYILVRFFQPIGFRASGSDSKHKFAGAAEYLKTFKNFSLLCSDDQVRRSFTEQYIIRCVSESDIELNHDNLPMSKLYVPTDFFVEIETLKRIN